MDVSELREKSAPELKQLEQEQREQLRSLRFDLSSGKSKSTDDVRKLKKDIAQIKTIISQRKHE